MKRFLMLTTTLLMTLPNAAKADATDALACELQSQTAAVAREIYYHFRGAPEFVPIYLQSLDLYRHAELLHSQADAHLGDGELCKTLECMRPLFQRIDAQVGRWEEAEEQGGVDSHGHALPVGPQAGYVSPFHLRRPCGQLTEIKATMDQMDGVLHPGASGVTPLPAPPGAGSNLPLPPQSNVFPGRPRSTVPRAMPPVLPSAPVQPQYESPIGPVPGPQFPQQSGRPKFQFQKRGFSVVIR